MINKIKKKLIFFCVEIAYYMGWIYYINDTIVLSFLGRGKLHIKEENSTYNYDYKDNIALVSRISDEIYNEITLLDELKNVVDKFNWQETNNKEFLAKILDIKSYYKKYYYINKLLDDSFVRIPLESSYFKDWSSYQKRHEEIHFSFCNHFRETIASSFDEKYRALLFYPLRKLDGERLLEVFYVTYSIKNNFIQVDEMFDELLSSLKNLTAEINRIDNLPVNEKPILRFLNNELELPVKTLTSFTPIIPWLIEKRDYVNIKNNLLLSDYWDRIVELAIRKIKLSMGNITSKSI